MVNTTNKGKKSEDGMLDHLQVARDLRDKLDDILSGSGEVSEIRGLVEFAAQQLGGQQAFSKGTKRGRVEIHDHSVCRHVCWEHAELMSPALWGSLPKDLLQLVLARLPLSKIIRLRCLSKEWNTATKTSGSAFLQDCEHAYPRMFALVSERQDVDSGGMWVRVFDTKANRWHAFHILAGSLGGNERLHGMDAGDGGLTCFVSTSMNKKTNPLRVIVVNPLTQAHKVLPLLRHLSSVQPKMVQLTMERQTKRYKVIVVGRDKPDTRPISGISAEIYNSVTQHWSVVDQSSDHLIFVTHFLWTRDDDGHHYWMGNGPCAYDCQNRQLRYLFGESQVMPFPDSGHDHTMLKNHLFVLNEERLQLCTQDDSSEDDFEDPYPASRRIHSITEYSAQIRASEWVKVKTYECIPFERLTRYDIDIHATKDFLLVVANNIDQPLYHQQVVWLYDYSTGTWRDIPAIPNDERYGHNPYMCELQWNVAP